MNVNGFHLHFISDDRTKGGHLLSRDVHNGTVRMDDAPKLLLEIH